MEEAYIVPGWVTIIAGLVIHRNREVLLGLRSARAESGKWCLPTGVGAIRRDISSALAIGAPQSLQDPMPIVSTMSERHQQAFFSPAGFALAEAKWYIQLPNVRVEQLIPLRPICQFDGRDILVKIYFGLEWGVHELPKPAETEWPFVEVKFFTKKELIGTPIAFGCDKDLESIFWHRLQCRK